ncbi:MAG: peptidoglycan -binding protein [Paracoccaceae bacterium]|nr:peptidoglycan -binding protein [Paracoccaceae bacterium]
MALTRRSVQRMSGSIWPGFVDAMTALLLVLMFVLTIFMIVQAIQRETISGQESELDQLASEVTSLSLALGLSQQRTATLEDDLSSLQNERTRQETLIANLTGQIDAQARSLAERDAAIASFEEQVATLLAERDDARAEGTRLAATLEDLEAAQARLITEQEAMQLALAQARDEIDAQAEEARLAAARREALEAMTAQLRAEAEDREAALTAAETALTEEEQARLAEAAAAEALRARLEEADAELTAMSLALEEERKEAEDTLTLLAAANAVEAELNSKLADALIQLETAEGGLASTEIAASELRDQLALIQTERDNALIAAETLRTRVSEAEAQLAALGATAEDRDATIASLTSERDRLAAEVETLRSSATDALTLREQLAAALAAKLAAENENAAQLTERERQETLLATARRQLQEEEAIAERAQLEVEALNQQVATLRAELGGLQNLLDSAAEADAEAQVRIEALGSQLNQALARAAAEEKRRAELEAAEAERLRLEAERLGEEVQDLADYRSEFFGTLRQLLGDREGVQIVGDRFVFSSEVLFESASATLSPAGQSSIAQVANILADVSGQIPPEIDWIIRVDGHTDNIPLSGTGAFADNWELSQARALSVVKFMTDFLGFPPERLAATGFGEYRPVNADDTPVARAQNRRIELKLTER